MSNIGGIYYIHLLNTNQVSYLNYNKLEVLVNRLEFSQGLSRYLLLNFFLDEDCLTDISPYALNTPANQWEQPGPSSPFDPTDEDDKEN